MSSPSARRLLGAGIALLFVFGAAFVLVRFSPGRPDAEALALRAEESVATRPAYFPAPEFAFRDQHGKRVTRQTLAGRVWIANFVYTTCTSVCPSLTAKFAMLARKLSSPALRFVSFSVDPARDTPEALLAYAERFRPGDDRWLLLATDPAGLAALARGLRVAVEPTGDARDPILHSTKFFLIDPHGAVKGIYDSADPMALARLAADAGTLAGASVAPPAGDAGARLVGELGCNGCHENAALAPTLHGIWGRSVELEGGARVTADEAYLRESILAPEAKLVRGYANLMPSYGTELSGAGLDSLVAYLRTLPEAPAGNAPASAALAMTVDPVCDMQVRPTGSTPHTVHAGRDVYFCSPACRDAFLAAPEKYSQKP
ncbi:MAG TPA: SCO family protein [Polyangiaceae bacterium]